MLEFVGLFDTSRDYTLQVTITHAHTSAHIHVFTSRCSIAASKGGRFPSSGFLNYPRPQLSASHSNSLNLSSSLADWLTQSLTNQLSSLTPLNWLSCL
jgi:hypothetical protein